MLIRSILRWKTALALKRSCNLSRAKIERINTVARHVLLQIVYFNSIVKDSLCLKRGIFYRDVTIILSIRLNKVLGHFSLSWNSYNVQMDKINMIPFVMRLLKAKSKKIWNINNGIHHVPGWGLKIIGFAGVLPRKPYNRREDAFFFT